MKSNLFFLITDLFKVEYPIPLQYIELGRHV